MTRVLAVALDGFEPSVADSMLNEGQLPTLASIRERTARFLLDHGSARATGLAWEQMSSGMSPNDANRWSMISFDKETYNVWQEGSQFPPFCSALAARTVVFDFPYFDLRRANTARGAVGWGAHDPGVNLFTRPENLHAEILAKYGEYPANQCMYDIAWPSPQRCHSMGAALEEGVCLRTRVALWLLKERLPDWQLALVHVSESHSALEAFWHGVDKRHLLHTHSSSGVAREAVQKVYRAIDRLLGSLTAEFEDATILVFSMHGMGPNRADVPGMVLLPELLYRLAFGGSFFEQPETWSLASDGIPDLREDEEWNIVTPDLRSTPRRVRDRVAALLPKNVKQALKQLVFDKRNPISEQHLSSLEWMPAARYRPLWPKMEAFALPSYYDGRIRINLRGREKRGIVSIENYENCCDKIGKILTECRDPFSGERPVEDIEWPGRYRTRELAASQADLHVNWKGTPLCLEHPKLGRIGPVPFRRTGGHTGPYGVAYLKSKIFAPGDYGVRSSFDIVPTLFELLGERSPATISGQSFC